MNSILEQYRRWFPSQDGEHEQKDAAVVPRCDSKGGRNVSDDEGGGGVVKGAIRRFDNINTSLKAGRLVSGGSSEEIGKDEMVVAGVDNLIEDTDEKIENNDSEIRRFGVPGQREGEMHEFQHPNRTIFWGDNTSYTTARNIDSGMRWRNLAREGNRDIRDLKPSEFWSNSQMETQKVSQESSVTKSTVLSQPQQINNNLSGSWCREGLLSPAGTLSEVVPGSVIDTQATERAPSEDKQREQVSESSGLQQLHSLEGNMRSRSSSLSECGKNASAATTAAAIRTDKGKSKSLPAKLKPENHTEKTVFCWKRERVSSVISRPVARRSKDATSTSSASSADAPDTPRWKGIVGRLSVRKVGNAVLNAVTQLFSQFVSKPLSPGGSLYRKSSSGKREQEDPQETAGDVNEKAHDDNDDGAAGKGVAKVNLRVKDLVKKIEDNMRDPTDTENRKDPTPERLKDEAVQQMTIPQIGEWEKRQLIKVKEIPKGGNLPDTDTQILQPATSKMKENEDQDNIEITDEAADSRLCAVWDMDGTKTQIANAEKEEEEKEVDEGGQEFKVVMEEADESESDTEEESEDEKSDIVMRSGPRSHPAVSRFSMIGLRGMQGQTNSIYRYSMIRPRTVIIGLGVCTETKFINDSFGDGVSETESEDEEDISPAPVPAPAPTPTHQRPTTPSRTSRPHSPLSDMDTESKRNSQAVSTEPSDLEDHSSVTTSDLDCHEPPVVDSRKDKAYRIALELLHTERTYVKVLHLIDQEFQFRVDNENRAHHMFPHDVILHMFSNIKSIYKLHHDFLLLQLEERMAQWEHNRRIGDIMKNFAPFLKMYTEYVRNFDNAMTLINQWQAKCPRFAAIMDDIHSMEVCGNLTLQHHMLSPVQRIPRYEMLLRDYLKKLPEDSPDCHDTEKALHLVSTAANHANDAMKKIDKFEKLLEIQESLGGAEDLVSPTRELIKEGKIIKISARSGDHQERYIFLLTDLLLLCSPRLMGGRVMSGPQYRLRAKYHVENLIIQEGDNLETANTFYIKDNNKSVELYTQTIEEKEQWLDAFIRAIHETSQRKSSLKLHFNPNQRIMDVDLGQKQPMLIRSDSVTKCMECGSQFTMVRRKHHCRACGAVVCSKCSSFKASLAYECGKSVRVCRTCHAALQELSSSTATPSPEIDEGDECSVYSAKDHLDLPFRNRGVLEVSAKTSGAVMQGFLQLKTHRKTWVKRWFALHTDFVLYSFKCEADDQALTATPVPGFTVTHLQGTRNESGISDKEKERAFKLHHAKKQYIFQAASKDESQRWVAALKKASQAELPSPVQ